MKFLLKCLNLLIVCDTTCSINGLVPIVAALIISQVLLKLVYLGRELFVFDLKRSDLSLGIFTGGA